MAGLLVIAGCSRHPVPPLAGEPPAVTVAVAVATNVPVRLQASGQVTAPATAAIQSPVAGMLEQVHFREGDEVAAGSLLFTIDPRPFQAELTQAVAELQRDKTLVRCARSKARWNAELMRQGIIPKNVWNPDGDTAGDLAAVTSDEASVARARRQLAGCDIRAPISGRTGLVKVSTGNWVKKMDTVLVTINQTRPIYADFQVPERAWAPIRAGLVAAGKLPVTATVPGDEPNPAVGELTSAGSEIAANADTICLRAIFSNRNERLLPGENIRLALTLTTLAPAVVVPSRCVRDGDRGQYVYVVQPDSTLAAHLVKAGQPAGGQTVLLQGVAAGELVVTGGEQPLAPRQQVRMRPPPPPPPATTQYEVSTAVPKVMAAF